MCHRMFRHVDKGALRDPPPFSPTPCCADLLGAPLVADADESVRAALAAFELNHPSVFYVVVTSLDAREVRTVLIALSVVWRSFLCVEVELGDL